MIIAFLGFWNSASGDVFYTEEEALEIIFPEAVNIDMEEYSLTRKWKKKLKKKWKVKFNSNYDNNFKFYIGKSSSNVISYAFIDTVEGKWGPITYIIKISSAGITENLAIIKFTEKRAVLVRNKTFLEQYIGKSIDNTLRIHKDIDAVTGATISSRAITRGVKKVLVLFNEFYIEKKDAK